MKSNDTKSRSQATRVIIIDDNPAIHDDFRKLLLKQRTACLDDIDSIENSIFGDQRVECGDSAERYELASAFQGEEGVRIAAQAVNDGQRFRVAFVDMRMPPGWDGVQTIKNLWFVDPHIQVVICTAYSDYSWSEIIEHLGHTDQLVVLRKPFDATEVSELTAAMAAKHRLAEQRRARATEAESEIAETTNAIQSELRSREESQKQLLEKEKQLQESQKFEALSLLAGSIAHEFNNLLQIILSYANFILDATATDHPIHHDMECVVNAGERANKLMRQLLRFSRRKPLHFEEVDINGIVGQSVTMAEPILGSRVKLEMQLDSDCPRIRGDAVELQQSLLNCFINARDAMNGVGLLRVSTEAIADESDGTPQVRILIEDEGCGMSDEVRSRIFEPFFSTKETGPGSGLGMSVVYGLV
ncbi:MAG: ATP-binding protein, partial [Planctomycetota bacterium]